MFANWYAELNFFCLATFTPVSDDSSHDQIRATWLILSLYACNMWHDSSTTWTCLYATVCGTWLLYDCYMTCDMTNPFMRHDSSIYVTRLIHLCDSSIYATWLVHLCNTTHPCMQHDLCIHTCATTHVFAPTSPLSLRMYMWRDSSIGATWLISVYTWHDSCVCSKFTVVAAYVHVTWLMHWCDMTHPCIHVIYLAATPRK